MSALTDWVASRDARERKFLFVGALALALALAVGLVMLDRSVSRAEAHLSRRERDLAWMRSVAPQLAAAGPPSSGPASGSGSSIIVIVNRSAHELGLGTALVSSEPSSQGGLRVHLQKAPFDRLVGWLERLSERHHVQVASATINGAGVPGRVNATLVLKAAP